MLPQVSKPGLIGHLARVQAQHRRDLTRGAGQVLLPGALARKIDRETLLRAGDEKRLAADPEARAIGKRLVKGAWDSPENYPEAVREKDRNF